MARKKKKKNSVHVYRIQYNYCTTVRCSMYKHQCSTKKEAKKKATKHAAADQAKAKERKKERGKEFFLSFFLSFSPTGKGEATLHYSGWTQEKREEMAFEKEEEEKESEGGEALADEGGEGPSDRPTDRPTPPHSFTPSGFFQLSKRGKQGGREGGDHLFCAKRTRGRRNARRIAVGSTKRWRKEQKMDLSSKKKKKKKREKVRKEGGKKEGRRTLLLSSTSFFLGCPLSLSLGLFFGDQPLEEKGLLSFFLPSQLDGRIIQLGRGRKRSGAREAINPPARRQIQVIKPLTTAHFRKRPFNKKLETPD